MTKEATQVHIGSKQVVATMLFWLIAMLTLCTAVSLSNQNVNNGDEQETSALIRGDTHLLSRWQRDVAATGELQQQQQQKKKKKSKKNNKKTKPTANEGTTATFSLLTDCLNSHNKWRQLHGASDLKWDTKLAKFAQKRADYIAKSDGSEFKHPKDLKFGENLAWHSNAQRTCSELIQLWYDEVELYDFSRAQFDHETGHFTQLVWKNTERVGCATAVSYGLNGGVYLVCNYDPAGNYLGEERDNVLPAQRKAQRVATSTSSTTTSTTTTTTTTTTETPIIISSTTTASTTTNAEKQLDGPKRKKGNKKSKKNSNKKNKNKKNKKKNKKGGNKNKRPTVAQTTTTTTAGPL